MQTQISIICQAKSGHLQVLILSLMGKLKNDIFIELSPFSKIT